MSRLLVVAGDPDVRAQLRRLLAGVGHEVADAGDGRAALREAYAFRPDLVVLGTCLPEGGQDLDGWQVLERIRDLSDVPVIMFGEAAEADRVRALRAGADDFLGAPPPHAELLARIDAVLRRSGAGATHWPEQLYDDGLVQLDPGAREVRVEGARVRLTPTEFRLLHALVRHPGVVLSPDQLLRQAWDDPSGTGPERVKFAVLRLRRKLGLADPATSPIESVRGFGYRYRRPPAAFGQ